MPQTSIQPPIQRELTRMAAAFSIREPADRCANAEQACRNWRVRIFEYGLSRNHYQIGHSAEPFTGDSSAPLLWTRRSAQLALRHLEGVGCFAGHAWERSRKKCPGLIGCFSQPSVGRQGPEAILTLFHKEN